MPFPFFQDAVEDLVVIRANMLDWIVDPIDDLGYYV